MTTATTKLTPVETLARLQELLTLATDYAVAEERMEVITRELLEHEDYWTEDLQHFNSAAHYEIKAALCDGSERTALQICQDVQDAIDILKLAIERDDRKKADDA